MNNAEEALKKHEEWKGKIEVTCRVQLETNEDLAAAYTPSVAFPCLEIQRDINRSFDLTARSNLVAVVTDGTAVLGLGNIGPEAGMPVMEGKCALFKKFGNVDAFPLCIRSENTDDIVRTVSLIQGSFGGINLEDISAPRCFEIENKLQQCCDIPVFHDDQHGTAIVTLAALLNALKLTGREKEKISVVVNGAGAAGTAIVKLLISDGIKNIIMCDRKGAVYKGRDGQTPEKEEIASVTNLNCRKGTLSEIIKNADVFIGVSAPGCLTPEMIRSMAENPVVFALANPEPEIFPENAKEAGAAVIGTGRSDFPNQINNVLVFPGIFRGALDVRASKINDEMKIAAAYAIKDCVSENELSEEYIISSVFDKNVSSAVARAVAEAAVKTGVSRLNSL